MHAVVNHMPIRANTDWDGIAAKTNQFFVETSKVHPKLKSALLVKTSNTEAIFVVVYEDKDAMDSLSSNVAAPWFAENIRPHLAAPVSRSVGEVIAATPG